MTFCFGSYGQAIKKAKKSPKTNIAIAGLLLSLITDNVDVYNQNGEPFDLSDKVASLYLNSKDHILQTIVDESGKKAIVDAATTYFSDVVIPELEPLLIDNLIMDLSNIITSDNDVPLTLKSEFAAIADKTHLPDFLSRTFLYAIKKENKVSALETAAQSDNVMKQALTEIEQAEALIKKYPRPQELPVPEAPKDEEMKYIQALLEVYSDESKLPTTFRLSDIENSSKYKKDLLRRRKDYYAAETIREGTRDSFGDTDETSFSILKEDIYDCIYDEYIKPHPTPMSRLHGVMNQAALSPATRCILLSKLDWVSAREKKGVCHFLVKDGMIKWVTDDD